MRHVFKTSYTQDLTIWRHRGDLFWYSLLVLILLLLPSCSAPSISAS